MLKHGGPILTLALFDPMRIQSEGMPFNGFSVATHVVGIDPGLLQTEQNGRGVHVGQADQKANTKNGSFEHCPRIELHIFDFDHGGFFAGDGQEFLLGTEHWDYRSHGEVM